MDEIVQAALELHEIMLFEHWCDVCETAQMIEEVYGVRQQYCPITVRINTLGEALERGGYRINTQ